MSTPALRIRLFGSLELACGDRLLPALPSAKARSLLAYLILHHGQLTSRDRLAGMFWPNRPDARARRAGVPVVFLEHGFFDRWTYSQADHEGILHWASWRRRLREPAPPEGAERLARFYPDGLVPVPLERAGEIKIG